MSYTEIRLHRGRASHFTVDVYRKRVVLIPSSFSFSKFKGEKKHECKWYVELKWSWLCFTFTWMIKRHRKG